MLPRPSEPRALWADIRVFARERGSHRWIAAGVAIAMPAILVFMFFYDSAHGGDLGPQIVYVQSWPANCTDARIKADQKKDQAERDAARKERQREFERLGKAMERFGI
jgi:hypothetical protein